MVVVSLSQFKNTRLVVDFGPLLGANGWSASTEARGANIQVLGLESDDITKHPRRK